MQKVIASNPTLLNFQPHSELIFHLSLFFKEFDQEGLRRKMHASRTSKRTAAICCGPLEVGAEGAERGCRAGTLVEGRQGLVDSIAQHCGQIGHGGCMDQDGCQREPAFRTYHLI